MAPTTLHSALCTHSPGEYKREELIERLRDLWRTDPVQEVGTEAQLALVQLGVFRVYSSDV